MTARFAVRGLPLGRNLNDCLRARGESCFGSNSALHNVCVAALDRPPASRSDVAQLSPYRRMTTVFTT